MASAAMSDSIPTPPRFFAPCAWVSAPARKFMTLSGAASWETVDLESEALAALRKETAEFAAPGCDTAIKELGSLVEDGEIGGVQVQFVSPKRVCGPEILLYFFGGGFVTGCPSEDLSMSARFAELLGRRVVAPNYSLAPEHPFPAARDDAMNVYRKLVEEDAASVIVVGQSAGGNLALGLVVAAAEANLAPPLAVALLSPWIDLTHSGDSHTTVEGLDPTLSVKHFLEPASLAYVGGTSTASHSVSPLFAKFPSAFPPTVISSATRDLLLSDSVRLAAKLRKQGATVELQLAEGLWHVYEYYPELPEATQSILDIAAFLMRHLPSQVAAEPAAVEPAACVQEAVT